MQTLSSLKRSCLVISLLLATGLSGCAKEPVPRTVDEFMSDGILLEAALVRCRQDRAGMRYDQECVNAREAVRIIEARATAERRELLEAQSQRKREALRRTQEAAAEARRQVAEAERRRREAEYLAQFGHPPPEDYAGEASLGNAPTAVISDPADEPEDDAGYRDSLPPAAGPAGDNAPAAEPEPDERQAQDLDAIRDELRRRNSESGGD